MATTVREVKTKAIEGIKQNVEESSIVLFADFKGLTVSQVTSLRRKIKVDGASMKVFKNTLTRRALSDLGIEYPAHFLVGPSSLIYTKGDALKLAKILVDFSKKSDQFTIKGGLFEKSVLNETNVKALAELPSREELIAKVIGNLKSPLTGLVTSLSGPARSFVCVLNSIKEKKQEV